VLIIIPYCIQGRRLRGGRLGPVLRAPRRRPGAAAPGRRLPRHLRHPAGRRGRICASARPVTPGPGGPAAAGERTGSEPVTATVTVTRRARRRLQVTSPGPGPAQCGAARRWLPEPRPRAALADPGDWPPPGPNSTQAPFTTANLKTRTVTVSDFRRAPGLEMPGRARCRRRRAGAARASAAARVSMVILVAPAAAAAQAAAAVAGPGHRDGAKS
jgi:hypothetical protein